MSSSVPPPPSYPPNVPNPATPPNPPASQQPGGGPAPWGQWRTLLLIPILLVVIGTGITLAVDPIMWLAKGPHDRGPAVRIVSTSITEVSTEGGTYVFPEARDLSVAQRHAAYVAEHSNAPERWIESQGGVFPHQSDVVVLLQGLWQGPVRVTAVQVNANCVAPLSGTLMLDPGAGSDSSVIIGFDLDSTRRIPYYIDGSGKKSAYFPGHTISLAENEQQQVVLRATTSQHYCRFTFTMKVTTDSGEQTLLVDDHGKPFQITAVPYKVTSRGLMYPTFQRLYIGGVLNPSAVNPWAPEDPRTYLAG